MSPRQRAFDVLERPLLEVAQNGQTSFSLQLRTLTGGVIRHMKDFFSLLLLLQPRPSWPKVCSEMSFFLCKGPFCFSFLLENHSESPSFVAS